MKHKVTLIIATDSKEDLKCIIDRIENCHVGSIDRDDLMFFEALSGTTSVIECIEVPANS
jgi:hypothetical protein